MIKFASIEELQDAADMINTIEIICREWAKQNLDNRWQHYVGWAFGGHGYIGINYSYNDIVNNVEYETEYGTKLVSWEELIEFSKTLEV